MSRIPEDSELGRSGGTDGQSARSGTSAHVAILWMALSLLLPTALLGQGDQAANSMGSVPGVPTAPVVFDGQELFRVRGVTAFPAEERAGVITERVQELAANRAVPAADLRLVEAGDHTNIQAGDLVLTGVFDADAVIEGVPRQTLSEVYRKRIQSAVEQYRKARDPRVLLRSTFFAAGATVLGFGLVFVLVWLFRRFDRIVENRYRSRIQGVRVKTLQLIPAEQIWLGVRAALRTLRSLVLAALFLLYAEYVLSLYPWTRPISQRGLAMLLDPLRTMGSAAVDALPNLLFIAVLAVVVRYILKLARLVAAGIEHGTLEIADFDPDWALPTYKIVRLLIVAFAFVVAYPYIPGAGSEAFKGVSIFIGVLVSLGSSSAIGNIIAGYTMTYRRLFKVGDRIQVEEVIGDVADIRLQVTHLQTPKNEEVTLPNSQILNSHVINYSKLAKDQGLILHTTVGIGYETPWRQVEAMLLMAAERTPGLLRAPAPFVLQKQLGDFCVIYEINVYCDSPKESPRLYTALHRSILDAFNEYGVQIMTPAYEGDPEQAKVVPKDKWFESPAELLQKVQGLFPQVNLEGDRAGGPAPEGDGADRQE